MDTSTIQILQLLIGSGIFLLMLRIAFQVGTYSNRLEMLEKQFIEWTRKVDKIDRNVALVLGRTNNIEG